MSALFLAKAFIVAAFGLGSLYMAAFTGFGVWACFDSKFEAEDLLSAAGFSLVTLVAWAATFFVAHLCFGVA